MSGPCNGLVGNEYELLNQIKVRGPFIAYVDTKGWEEYAGGIFSGTCSHHADDGNHAVQIMGMGQQDGQTYWLVKNSWGVEWGEKGYIRIPAGQNKCGIVNFVAMAKWEQ